MPTRKRANRKPENTESVETDQVAEKPLEDASPVDTVADADGEATTATTDEGSTDDDAPDEGSTDDDAPVMVKALLVDSSYTLARNIATGNFSVMGYGTADDLAGFHEVVVPAPGGYYHCPISSGVKEVKPEKGNATVSFKSEGVYFRSNVDEAPEVKPEE